MPITFGTSDELGENKAVRTQGTLGQFKGLQNFVQAMLELEGEVFHAGQGNHEIGDLGAFLAPFGIHPRRGCHGLEARVAIGPTLVRKDLTPGHQTQTAPKRNWVGERKTRVVLPLRKDSPSENQDL